MDKKIKIVLKEDWTLDSNLYKAGTTIEIDPEVLESIKNAGIQLEIISDKINAK